ncbi:hypothetical protein HY090_02255 [Candidatus Kaiserbacteria bacterium]|nr:hypothetical protein [Candidatus Kaiserbacteria bacterium]
MSFITRYKTVILVIVLVIIAFFAYSYFFTGAPQAVLSSQAVSANTAIDQDLINLLLTLRAIRLDDSLFTNANFQSLQDFSKDLVPEPVGRANPFAPLGSVSAGSASKK